MDFLSICRFCLAENLQLCSIFDVCEGTNIKFTEIIANIAGNEIQIDELDLLSKNICSSCKSQCKEYLRFRETIVSSAEYQLKTLQQNIKHDEDQYEEIIINELEIDNDEAQKELDEDYSALEIESNDHVDVLLSEAYEGFITASSDEESDENSCSKCDKHFPTKRKLSDHMKTHSTKVRLHECSTCKRKFLSEMQLLKHEIIHSDLITQIKDESAYRCIICKEVVSDKQELDEHMREHKINFETDSNQCIECNKSFDKFVALVRHLKKHDENKTHLCKICNKTFALGPELIEHLNRHKGFRPHTCHICGKSYHQASKLKVHLDTHSEEKSFLCTECGKSFNRNSNLRQHLLRHSGVKPFSCPQCPSKFISKGNLKAHMITHQNAKPYVCNVCGSRFTQSFSLVKHNRIHTGDRPYSCELCSMRFYSSDHLKRHVRTHTGEKPFKCPFCPKAFAQNGDLNKHKRIHVGENTYICDFPGCKDSFRLLSELRDHHKIHYSTDQDNYEGVDSIIDDEKPNIT
ncbi:unnamed protein product [Chironomus riparius]|uniref:Uncharacterized protein n=1 Tax=Chironomus riparius TaxID=315576 RepID=A0A9N9S1V7_9DIPT|nr:unnamed protein product [Chironomus riparius]